MESLHKPDTNRETENWRIVPIEIYWPHRLAVRTLASHAGNRGSIPLGATLTTLVSIACISVWLFYDRIVVQPNLRFTIVNGIDID